MSNRKNKRAEEDSPANRHGAQKACKGKGSKENLFAKRGNKHAGDQGRIGRQRSRLALLQNDLIVRLDLDMKMGIQVANHQAVQQVQHKNAQKQPDNPGQRTGNMKSSQAQRSAGLSPTIRQMAKRAPRDKKGSDQESAFNQRSQDKGNDRIEQIDVWRKRGGV